MYGDFSRQTFDPRKHYTGVWMQQGRVQLDADWNEAQAIHQYRFETEARDVIGPSGAPIHESDTDFKITVQHDDNGQFLQIGQGRYYVNGLLCENQHDVRFTSQPYFPEHQSLQEFLETKKTSLALLYLDVWERPISALDDPHISEVALGGIDTTIRTQAVWQVKALPLPLPPGVQDRMAALKDLLREPATSRTRDQNDEIEEQHRREIKEFWHRTTCNSSFDEWSQLIASSTGTLEARTQPPGEQDGHYLVPPSYGYQLLENQLYRVEVHHGSDGKKPPTFKWSRDNGSVVTLIESIKDNMMVVQDIGADETHGFATGQWVELVDDLTELKGEPGQLLRILQVNTITRTITVDKTVRKVSMGWKPKLRRWDQSGISATDQGVQAAALPEKSASMSGQGMYHHQGYDLPPTFNWLPLEGGIQVRFSSGSYKTGDYWLIPARAVTGQIEWPKGSNGEPAAQRPQGIQHHYARLALVLFDPGEEAPRIQDCRQHFPALASNAMHVLDTNWKNDGVVSLPHFIEKGLHIRLDAMPDSKSVKAATVIVTLEVLELVGLDEGKLPHSSCTLSGKTRVEDNVIKWHWLHGTEKKLVDWLSKLLRDLHIPTLIRVRVTLKGHAIWSSSWDRRLYLDGQSFGYEVERSEEEKRSFSYEVEHPREEKWSFGYDIERSEDEKRFAALQTHYEHIELVGAQRTELQFPSGNGTRASDFESWFYLV